MKLLEEEFAIPIFHRFSSRLRIHKSGFDRVTQANLRGMPLSGGNLHLTLGMLAAAARFKIILIL
jgi:hypothetical protein